MLITLKNKDTLIVSDFIFRCSVGKNQPKIKKKEGDKITPKGTFSIGKLYYRADKVRKPKTKITVRVIKKNMGWCDDPRSKHYNKEIKIDKRIRHEKLFRNDNIYNYFIVINYNTKKIIPYKGSAIFLHLTNNYKPTNGCVAIKRNDFEVLLKLINKKTKIKIT